MRDGDEYVLNGRKWWSSGAGDPRCKIAIFMGKTDPAAPRHKQQSMILVPMDTPGVTIERMLPVFGYDDAPHGHGEVVFDNVRVPASQHAAGRRPRLRDRAGPAGAGPHPSLHAADRRGRARAGSDVPARASRAWRSAKTLAEQGTIRADIADSRMEIEQARLLTLKAAYMMDTVGNKAARAEIAMIKVVAPEHGAARARPRHPGARRRRRLRTISSWPPPGPTRARCAWPTDPTKCIARPSRNWS